MANCNIVLVRYAVSVIDSLALFGASLWLTDADDDHCPSVLFFVKVESVVFLPFTFLDFNFYDSGNDLNLWEFT